MNFETAQRRARAIKPSIVSRDLFKYIRAIESEFINRNIEQIEDSKDSQGRLLENKDSRFDGVYSEATAGFALLDKPLAPKVPGEPYNFLYTGDFIQGFELFISNNTIELFSTGKGSGEKADFFKGYENLFGLTDPHLKEVIETNILPFIQNYYRQRMT